MNQFKKGNIPHNKGKKLNEYLSNSKIEKIKNTQFKPGQITAEKSNMWKGGIQTPKNDVVHLYAGINKRVRRPKTIYEQHYGLIPKGWIIYHLNGVMTDDSLDNMIAIPRAILLKLNNGRLNNNYHEIQQLINQYNNERNYKKYL